MLAHFLQTRFGIVINIIWWENIKKRRGKLKIISVYEGYFNNVIMDFLKIVKSLILFIAQVISPKKSLKLLRYRD
jgi:hypothetical protein